MLFKDERRLYHLGPSVGLMVDAFQRQNSPPEYLPAPLRRLAEDTGETTYLSAAADSTSWCVASVEGSQAVRVRGLHVGFRGFAHARGSGKLMLAHARRRGHRALPGDGASPRARRTRSSIPRPCAPSCARSRPSATPSTRRSSAEGVSGVSAPVRARRAVAAYTVSAPTERFHARRDELIAAVLAWRPAPPSKQEP